MLEGKLITETSLYKSLLERYVHNLKEKVMEPFLKNDNFRRAIKDYATDSFKAYDKRIREEVAFLMANLERKFGYTAQGAKEICIYVIDNDLQRPSLRRLDNCPENRNQTWATLSAKS
jgi:hypothetical protein